MKKFFVILFCLFLSGCQMKVADWSLFAIEKSPTTAILMHPIDKQDCLEVKKGTMVGEWQADRDGYFVSEKYMQEVMNVQVEK